MLIIGLLLEAAAIYYCFVPRGWNALTAFGGMLFLQAAGVVHPDPQQLWFWGAAAFIVLALSVLLPAPVVSSRRGVAYIVIATVAGLLLGLLISANVMVLGGVLGAVCGALAYSRTPAGKTLDFPSRRFVNYLAAKALPPVITLSIMAITLVLALDAPHSVLLN